MQRDFDLVVTILGELRDADTAALSQEEIEAALQVSMPDAPPTALIAHHLDILSDAGLITLATVTSDSDTDTWRLTWKGHDALEQEEEDEDEEEYEEDEEDEIDDEEEED